MVWISQSENEYRKDFRQLRSEMFFEHIFLLNWVLNHVHMFNQHKIFRVFKLINALRAEPPKSPQALSQLLEISERSVYRYMGLIGELGFKIQKDEGKFRIDKVQGICAPFSNEELEFLTRLLHTSGKSNPLHTSILAKLPALTEQEAGVREIEHAQLDQTVSQLARAILEKKQVTLKNYFSAHSGSVRSRRIEPVQFTENYRAISGFEVDSGTNKYFNIERISEVIVHEDSFEFESEHRYFEPDVFGFQGKDLTKFVEIELSLRAYIFLKEEVPKAVPFLEELGSGNYLLTVYVQDFKGPARFVRGFPEDTKVVGSEEFLEFLKA